MLLGRNSTPVPADTNSMRPKLLPSPPLLSPCAKPHRAHLSLARMLFATRTCPSLYLCRVGPTAYCSSSPNLVRFAPTANILSAS